MIAIYYNTLCECGLSLSLSQNILLDCTHPSSCEDILTETTESETMDNGRAIVHDILKKAKQGRQ